MLSFRISPILNIPIASAPPVVQKTNAVRRKAIKLYNDGLKSFRREKFEEALSYFQASYALIKNYNTLYSISGCLSKLGRLKEAIEAYKLFLKERLPLPNPKEDKEEIELVKQTIAKFESVEAKLEKELREAEAPKTTPTLTTPKPQPTKLEPKPQPQPSPPPPSYRKWGTVTAFILSAASAAVGLASHILADKREQSHDNLFGELKASGQIVCESGNCRFVNNDAKQTYGSKLSGLENDVKKYNRLEIVMFSTAAAASALGAGLLLLGKPQQKPKVSLSPTIGDQFGLGLSIEF